MGASLRIIGDERAVRKSSGSSPSISTLLSNTTRAKEGPIRDVYLLLPSFWFGFNEGRAGADIVTDGG